MPPLLPSDLGTLALAPSTPEEHVGELLRLAEDLARGLEIVASPGLKLWLKANLDPEHPGLVLAGETP